MLKRFFYRIGIVLAILAANWLIVGVIVEFHQIHVYKNHVSVWKIMAANAAGKDKKKLIQAPQNSQLKVFDGGLQAGRIPMNADIVCYMLAENTIYARNLFDLITPEYRYDKVLRGPPAIS